MFTIFEWLMVVWDISVCSHIYSSTRFHSVVCTYLSLVPEITIINEQSSHNVDGLSSQYSITNSKTRNVSDLQYPVIKEIKQWFTSKTSKMIFLCLSFRQPQAYNQIQIELWLSFPP